jgi:hypothetical protein
MNNKIKKIIFKWMGINENPSSVKNIPEKNVPLNIAYEAHYIWESILKRCYVPRYLIFHIWGGEGYEICDEWKNHPDLFFQWLDKNNWNNEMKVNIKEGSKIFSPSNCFLTTYRKYVNEGIEKTGFYYKYNEKEKTLRQWSKECDINYTTLRARMVYFDGDITKSLEHNFHSWRKNIHKSTHMKNDPEIGKLHEKSGDCIERREVV